MSILKSKGGMEHTSFLSEKKVLAEIDRVFFKDGYQLACNILGNELSGNSILFLTRKLYAEISYLHKFSRPDH